MLEDRRRLQIKVCRVSEIESYASRFELSRVVEKLMREAEQKAEQEKAAREAALQAEAASGGYKRIRRNSF